MKYIREYVEYLVHFHGDRDFFECHEILEDYWKREGKREEHWVVLIQIAVGLYHERRGNRAGALKMLQSAIRRLSAAGPTDLGLDVRKLVSMLQRRKDDIGKGSPYRDLNLPIADPVLLDECLRLCAARGWVWQAESGKDADLIHRHSLRDRTDVIREREE